MRGCETPNCTVALTGICIRGRDADTCEDRLPDDGTDAPTDVEGVGDAGVDADVTAMLADLPEPVARAQMYPGLELGLDDARRLNSRTRCHLIGILGAPDAGKTAALVSLYLLLARARLASFRFGNSRSLMAFEQLARGSRRWEDGNIPHQLTGHTKLEDPRSPGFLHLRLSRVANEAAFDLLLPDLPGEWTDELIDNDEHDRLSFLSDAKALWVMADGVVFVDPDRRKDPIGRTKSLLTRMAKFAPLMVPLIFVLTRRDQSGAIPPGTFDGVVQRARDLGFTNVSVLEVASFAAPETGVAAGLGIEELLERSLVPEDEPPPMAATSRETPTDARQMLRFRRHG